jgi:hypothetical protein
MKKSAWLVLCVGFSVVALSACNSKSGRGCFPAEDPDCVCKNQLGESCERSELDCQCRIEEGSGDQDMSEEDAVEDTSDAAEDTSDAEGDAEDVVEPDAADVPEDVEDMIAPDLSDVPEDLADVVEPDVADVPEDLADVVEPDVADVPEDLADVVEPDMVEPPARQRYVVTIQNLTKQPLGPVVAATHDAGLHLWQEGALASPGIKVIAEMGVPFTFYDEVAATPGVTQVINAGVPMTPRGETRAAFGPFPPGATLRDHVSFVVEGEPGDLLSLASMVVISNDGFWGLDAVALPEAGTVVYLSDAYDAGTEENSELSMHLDDGGSILGLVALPGDPNGNMGVATDPAQPIAPHGGLLGAGDLTVESHGWGAHVARVMVTALPAGADAAYEVFVENLSKQPLGPCVGATHDEGVHLWQEGALASPGIKVIAEMGAPFVFFDEASATAGVTQAVNAGLPVAPAGVERMTFGPFPPMVELYDHIAFHVTGGAGDRFSLASMLVATNDGFWGLDGAALPAEGELVYMTLGYDAGTEENNELSTHLDDGGSILGLVVMAGDPNGNMAVATDPAQPIAPHAGIMGVGQLSAESHGWTPGASVARVTLLRVPVRVDLRCLEGGACP